MKHLSFGLTALAIIFLSFSRVTAQRPESSSGRAGFDFGGATEFDRLPLGKTDAEKRAFAVLEEDLRCRPVIFAMSVFPPSFGR